jgi:dolichol-phosphate mannosyltransferase
LIPRVSIVIPAYEEGEQIVNVLRRNLEAVTLPCEILVVVDDPSDSTLPYVAKVCGEDPSVRALVNTYGRGPANAIRYGIDHAVAPVAVVTMADGCDDPFQIDDLTRLVVAAASRYARTGQQVGGPWVKGSLSRLAGLSLHYLARVGTKDATNSFKAYSVPFVRTVGIESDRGFEIGIELVAKARRARMPVAEIPTIWLDRAFGSSNFKMRAWLVRYVRWYVYAFGPKKALDGLERLPDGSYVSQSDKEAGR